MKKLVLYVVLFLSGLVIGASIFEASGDTKREMKRIPSDYLSVNKPTPSEENPTEFLQSAQALLGKTLTVNGKIEEVYKNKRNEVVIYMKDKKIPVIINCTLQGSDRQIKWALKLGEPISIKGKFTKIGDEMRLEKCKIMHRSPE